MDLVYLAIKFFILSALCAIGIWVFCYIFDVESWLIKFVPRNLRELVIVEKSVTEETGLSRRGKRKRRRVFTAFIQMIIVEIFLSPVLFPANLLIVMEVLD